MQQASHHIECDLLVVGGGINGAGIARDAAGRGLSVLLCEKDDLASHTSSASTKLIHGGLRYLEHYEFQLVRKALIEREVLLRAAPHIMWPLRFVMPHESSQRPAWMIRAGLLMYDLLARRELLPGSRGIDLRRHPAGAPLRAGFSRGFEYSDGWVDDARLVVLNAIDAADKGAKIMPRCRCETVERHADHWTAALRTADGRALTVRARALVNAAGPWAAQFLQASVRQQSNKALRLIKGSHIVVPRLFDHPYAYIFQNSDGRIVFAIPYEREFTLLGTTDLDYRGSLDQVAIEEGEVDYICGLANHYFEKRITPADVVWSYSGVRPLLEDESANASAVTRDYRLEFDAGDSHGKRAPLLSVFGGKITTFRKLAEEAVDRIAPALGNHRGAWTEHACLPGGDLYGERPANRSVLEFDRYVQDLQKLYSWLPAPLVARYARAYGTRIHLLLTGRTAPDQMGEEIAPGLFAAEVEYLVAHEWAATGADILWRRSKLGLHLERGVEPLLNAWIAARMPDLRRAAGAPCPAGANAGLSAPAKV
ncbi:glycerol-3-phosphate dehydrogenase [Noviherbaspirillum sedimenti]|uniref:Glycerol-3-phosphate dehydrogenase n=1 Tax=Noviherbaspirillum sedimenti TaxID=2320865 RepID=A0A3A3G2H9_9BURK|nr:glycerol-3-phosphate dehydrogenase [Noviherbaspirillum sedimenti]RJG02084.1 glycerol-3-phosphate dehydrogenase [Noviherbaspirillum sedimenti]